MRVEVAALSLKKIFEDVQNFCEGKDAEGILKSIKVLNNSLKKEYVVDGESTSLGVDLIMIEWPSNQLEAMSADNLDV